MKFHDCVFTCGRAVWDCRDNSALMGLNMLHYSGNEARMSVPTGRKIGNGQSSHSELN